MSHIFRLKTALSEKIVSSAIKAKIKIIGRLIIAPAMPVDIPNRIDRLKESKIATTAYHCGKVPYKTVAMQPVQTCAPRWLSFRQKGLWIVLFSMIVPV